MSYTTKYHVTPRLVRRLVSRGPLFLLLFLSVSRSAEVPRVVRLALEQALPDATPRVSRFTKRHHPNLACLSLLANACVMLHPCIRFRRFISFRCQKKAGYKSVWGSDPPRAGAIEQHTVKSISYHQGGSSRRAKGAQPFAIIELEVTWLL